jgi:hypothetical protein
LVTKPRVGELEDAGLAEQRRRHGALIDQRSRVRLHRDRALLRAPGLERQDRRLRRDLRSHLEELLGVLEAFDLDHDRARALVLAVVLQDLGHRQIRLVPVRAVHAVADADVVQVQLQHLAAPAALRHDRDPARLHRDERDVRVDRDLGVGVLDALRVRAEDADAVLVRGLHHLLLQGQALLADLLEARGVHDRELDALLPELVHEARQELRRDRDVHEVDLVRHVEHGLEAFHAHDARRLGVDREDRPLEAVLDQALLHDVPDRERVLGGADDRDGTRTEEGVESGHFIVPPFFQKPGSREIRSQDCLRLLLSLSLFFLGFLASWPLGFLASILKAVRQTPRSA